MGDPEFTDTKRLEKKALAAMIDDYRSRRDRQGSGGDMAKWASVTVAILVAIGAAAGSWVSNAERITKAETQIAQVENRQTEDRAALRAEVRRELDTVKEDRQQIKSKVDRIDSGVQQILIEMRTAQAAAKERDRRNRVERNGSTSQ